MKSVIYKITIVIAAIVMASGCSTTKRLGEDDVLYTGVKKMKVESIVDEDVPGRVESAVKEPLSVKPNNPLWSPYIRTPLPIGLWAWNYLYIEDTRGLKAWLYRRLAKKPVLVSDVQPELRVRLVEQILDNHGYFGSSASYEMIPKRNPKKARISYMVEVPHSWHYSNVEFPEVCCPVTAVIDSLGLTTKIRVGERYDIDTLTAERIRITNHLRDMGYYYFRPDYIEYLADTTQNYREVDLHMIMANGIPPDAMRSYKVGEINVDFYNPEGGEQDSMVYNDIRIRYQQPLKIRRKVLQRSLTMQQGETVRVSEINRTLGNLTKLGIFRYANLSVTPLDSIRGADSINMDIVAAFDAPLQAEFEVDFNSKSNSFIGPGLIFGVNHKNVFRGGEVLAFRFNGAYEWQTGNTRNQVNTSSINSYEAGFTSSLTFPRLLAPRFISRNTRYDPRTTFQLGANLLNRPNFFTMISFNGSMAYDFQTSQYSYHNLTLFKMVYNHLLRTTDEFDQIMRENRALALSFQNQFIPSASYTYTFDQPWGPDRRDRLVWQSTVTSAGNLFYGISKLTDSGVDSAGNRKLIGTSFSQFVKGVTEVRHYHNFGTNYTLASRVGIGVGYPYGNSEVLPYSEQFYVGGANSIRAFTVRSIGPGSYRPDSEELYGYFDQTGEIKLEANVEFRFRIAGSLHGAAFFDAGNVWLLRNDDKRPGGQINFRKMWDQIAIGTGAGLRLDISLLVIRADLGVGLHLPYNTTRGGYYNIPRFKDGLGFHLAIGYPF